jgi:hypothetical protein
VDERVSQQKSSTLHGALLEFDILEAKGRGVA